MERVVIAVGQVVVAGKRERDESFLTLLEDLFAYCLVDTAAGDLDLFLGVPPDHIEVEHEY